MLAAMTHPSRVLNLDMKAKALYAKELYLTLIYIYIYKQKKTLKVSCELPFLIITSNKQYLQREWEM